MSDLRVDQNLISRVSQFYYREARLLDNRQFQQWMTLIDESIEYSMPTRYVPQPNPQEQDKEEFLSVEHELDRANGGKGSPIRHDHYLELMVRSIRPYKTNAWSESPPPRTRRFISNIEVEAVGADEYDVYSNFQMFYSHSGANNHTYTGGRRDSLKEIDGQFRIFKREVIVDWDIITVPTLALIF